MSTKPLAASTPGPQAEQKELPRIGGIALYSVIFTVHEKTSTIEIVEIGKKKEDPYESINKNVK